ncbi:MAG TPA: hypothetical protein VFP64_08935 [Pyrinomonadaceae bacterium]|nr:hypothetical protein [Pyrinomonadaceae bacterium]
MSAISCDLIRSVAMTSEFSIPTAIEGDQDFVRNGDVILFVTGNHSYRFVVTNCESRRGLLSGGALGERQFNATTSSSFQEGYGVSFKIGLPDECYRMSTSDVVELVCVREGEHTRRGIIKFPSFISEMETRHHEI